MVVPALSDIVRAGTSAFAGGGGSPGGATTQVQFNDAGAFAGASEVEIEDNQLRLENAGAVSAPAAGGVKLVGQTAAGLTLPAFLSQDGALRNFQRSLADSFPLIWKSHFGANALSSVAGGAVPTALGTATINAAATGSVFGYINKLSWLVTVAATTAVAGFYRNANNLRTVTVGGPGADRGGFHFVGIWGPSTGVATATHRAMFGLTTAIAAPTDVQPSTLLNGVFMGWDAADANIQIMHNDGTGACTKIDLGASFPVPTVNDASLYKLEMYSPKGTTQSVSYTVTDIISGDTVSGQITTDMPSGTTLLSPRGYCSVGGTSSVVGFNFVSLYLDPLI